MPESSRSLLRSLVSMLIEHSRHRQGNFSTVQDDAGSFQKLMGLFCAIPDLA